MNKTTIVQNNTEVFVSPDVQEYRIETTVTVAGELPHTQIFVYTINDFANPAADVFARVATPGDLDGNAVLPLSRDLAITAGGTEYLTSVFVVQYPDLTIASQARKMIPSRVNDLINNWILYRDQFLLYNNEDQYFPTVDPTVEQALTDTYTEARAARIVAEADLVIASTDLILAEKDAATAQQIVAIRDFEMTFDKKTHKVDWPQLDVALSLLLTGASTFSVSAKTQLAAAATIALSTPITWPLTPTQLALLFALPTYGSIYNATYNSIIAFDTVFSTYSTNGAPARAAMGPGLDTFGASVTAYYAAAVNSKAAADSLVADAVTTKKEAEATVASARKAEDAALAAIKSVCPTFDPATV